MRKNRKFAFGLMLLALQSCQPACDAIDRGIVIVSDPIGWGKAILAEYGGIVWNSAVTEFVARWVPTHWIFWVMALVTIITLWLPMRGRTQRMMVFIFRKILPWTLLAYTWKVAWGLMFLIVPIIIIAWLVNRWITTAKERAKKAKEAVEGVWNFFTGWGDRAAKIADESKEKGAEASEEDSESKKYALAFISLIAMVAIMAVLFGGSIYPDGTTKATIGQHIDFVLRLIGIGFFVVGLIRGVKDLMSRVPCPNPECGETYWNLDHREDYCTNIDCRYPNPKNTWTCCKQKYPGTKRTPCGVCGKHRDSLPPEWREAAANTGEKCVKCQKVIGTDDAICPNKQCKFPVLTKEWECGHCDTPGNAGTSLICQCGKRRKGVHAKWRQEDLTPVNQPAALPPAQAPAPAPAQPPAPRERHCTRCNTRVDHAFPNCEDCGGAVADGPPAPVARVCPRCHARAEHEYPNCEDCGAKIDQ